MDSPCIKQTVCKVLKIFQYGKYLVAYVLKDKSVISSVPKYFNITETHLLQYSRLLRLSKLDSFISPITANLDVIHDARVRNIISKGPRYRFLSNIDFP